MADRRPVDEPSGEGTAALPDMIAASPHEGGDDDDADSSLGDYAASSTASVASSILQYRVIHGRTFHSERHNTASFTPNDNQQIDSIDLSHHYQFLLIDGKLCLAPIKDDVQKVLDIGTGSGIWAVDFADAYPSAEVTGTDLSPTQPVWAPPNVKFEIDDATLPWTWAEGTFDFVHIRYLTGSIADWPTLFAEAFRTCKPGGWVESCEVDIEFLSDDGTTDDVPVIKTWNQLFSEGGKKFGRSFTVLKDNSQWDGIKAAGFENVQVKNLKVPIGGWPADKKLAEVGRVLQLALLNDIEGYTLFLWNNIMGWPKDEWQVFLMEMRKVVKNRNIHAYLLGRYVYGQKPESKTKC